MTRTIAASLTVLVALVIPGLLDARGPGARSSRPETAQPPPSRAHLDVPLVGQEQTLWCWAACTEMVLRAHGTVMSQCEIADRHPRIVGKPCPCDSCATAAPSGRCNTGEFPDLASVGLQGERGPADTPLSWPSLAAELGGSPGSSGRPVLFAHHHRAGLGAGHMSVAIGYAVVDSIAHVEVNDPLAAGYRCKGDYYFVDYRAYVGGTNWSHWDDLSGIAPAGLRADRVRPADWGDVRFADATYPTRTAAAEAGRLRFPQFVFEDNYRLLGFPSPDPTAAELQLGEPIDEWILAPSDNAMMRTRPQQPLESSHDALYPVLRGGETVAAVKVTSEAGGRWRPYLYGAPETARAVNEGRARMAAEDGVDPSLIQLVRVPGLNQWYLVRPSADDLVFAPLGPGRPGDPTEGVRYRLPDVLDRARLPRGGLGRGPS